MTVAGCAPASETAATEDITIAFVMGAESDPFFQAMKLGAEEEAAAQGVTLIWQGDPSNYSPETQIPIVDAVLAQQPDGLVLIQPTQPHFRHQLLRLLQLELLLQTLTLALKT
jgi:ABC-type sugar transport system substrate-binding protein